MKSPVFVRVSGSGNELCAVIGNSCLGYIFSILSFSVLYFISISEIPDAKSSRCILVIFFFFSSNSVQYVYSQFKGECCSAARWHSRSGNTLSAKSVLRSQTDSVFLQPEFETQEPECVERTSSELMTVSWFGTQRPHTVQYTQASVICVCSSYSGSVCKASLSQALKFLELN